MRTPTTWIVSISQSASARVPYAGGAKADSPAGCLDPGIYPTPGGKAGRDCLPTQAAPSPFPGAGTRQAGSGLAHRSAGAGGPVDFWRRPTSRSGAVRVCSAGPVFRSRRAVLTLTILLAAVGTLLLGAAHSEAAFSPHTFTTYFGAAGSTPSNPYPLSGPSDVAVDQSSHDFYVTDTGNHRVEKFDPAGHLILIFGKGVNKTQALAHAPEAQQNVCDPAVDECQAGEPSATSSPGSLNTPTFIAVDNSGGPSEGDVYVADGFGKGIVSKFDSGGNLIVSWGVEGQLVQTEGVDGIAVTSTGGLAVMSTEYPFKMGRYSQAGLRTGYFVVPVSNGIAEQGIAVDARERFFKGGNAEIPYVSEFTESGESVAGLAPGPITGLDTDPFSNDLYLDEQGTFISHLQSQCGTSCTPLETFGSGKLSNARGLTVDAPSDNVYVANAGANDVAVFSGLAPYATTGQASSVGHTSATLTGHVADGGRGEITGCHFEYGTTESYEAGSVPCEPGAPFGSEADVTAKLAGLVSETTYHFRLVATNSAGTAFGADQMVTPEFVINTSTEQATNVTNEAAELNGSYVGDGTATSYHFDYGSSETYEHSSPEQANGSGVGPQSLPPVALSGLQPHTTYHFRLVTKNSLGTTYGHDLTFTTADRPELGRTSTSRVTATTAELHAQINPRGADTTYHFEYGTSTNYGTVEPIPSKDIGAGYGLQTVTLKLTNLQIGATYHFRVVAENTYGSVVSEDQDFGFYAPQCPNSTIRQETGANYLPDCRAYELVSPEEAGSVSLYPVGPTSPEATSPARLAYGGWLNLIPGTGEPVNATGDLYVSTRTDTGWTTRYVGVPSTQTNETNGPPGDPTNQIFVAAPAGVRTNPSMSTFLDWNLPNTGGFAAMQPPVEYAPHVWAADGSSMGVWPTSSGVPVGPILNQSADFTHYYYLSGVTVIQGGEYNEYCCYEGGTAYDNNVTAGTVSPIGINSEGASITVRGVPHSSTDGTRILMSTAACTDPSPGSCGPGELFLRVDDAVTYDIAKGHVVQYVATAADDSKVYFTSAEPLTAADKDTSTDLYMWSETTKEVTLISAGTGGAGNSDECSATWIEKCGVAYFTSPFYARTESHGGMYGNGLSDNAVASENGDIYFFSPEQLVENTGVRNQVNVYLYRNSTLQYVTTLGPEGTCETEYPYGCSSGPIARIQVTPNDSEMAFVSSNRVTAYENAHHTEMYKYTPSDGEILCVSCKPDGSPPTSDVWASSNGSFMTNDGRTFFSTSDALTTRDTDERRDIYEYVEGHAQLISSGTTGRDVAGFIFNPTLFTSGLVGVTADGTNAYFTTYDTLVGQDRNGNFLKFYDARTNGGFPFVSPGAPCEAADECVGHGTSPPEVPADTSGAALGLGGNVSHSPAKRRRRKSKHSRHHRKAGSRAKSKKGHRRG